MPLSRLERETVLNWNDAEEMASIYTSSPAVRRRLTKRLRREPDRSGTSWAEWFIPKAWAGLPRFKEKRAASPGQIENLQRGR